MQQMNSFCPRKIAIDYIWLDNSSTTLAGRLCRADLNWLHFYGEPPLPEMSSVAEYTKYVLSLDGRIDLIFCR